MYNRSISNYLNVLNKADHLHNLTESLSIIGRIVLFTSTPVIFTAAALSLSYTATTFAIVATTETVLCSANYAPKFTGKMLTICYNIPILGSSLASAVTIKEPIEIKLFEKIYDYSLEFIPGCTLAKDVFKNAYNHKMIAGNNVLKLSITETLLRNAAAKCNDNSYQKSILNYNADNIEYLKNIGYEAIGNNISKASKDLYELCFTNLFFDKLEQDQLVIAGNVSDQQVNVI